MKNFNVSVDSGAHSFLIQHQKSKKSRDLHQYDFDFVKTKEFKEYLDDYIYFLHCTKQHYSFFVSLDVIGNAQYSWDILKYIESNGLNPVPVFHISEDFSFLKRLVDNYSYIGMGGLTARYPGADPYLWGKQCFDIICNGNKSPFVKVHGFGVNALPMIKRYPFYSFDASTWCFGARLGHVFVPYPIMKNKDIIGWNYFTDSTSSIAVTEGRMKDAAHYLRKSPTIQKICDSYFESLGFSYEILKSNYLSRDIANAKYYINAANEAKKHYQIEFDYNEGGHIYLAGNISSCNNNMDRMAIFFDELKEPEVNILHTFFYPAYSIKNNAFQYIWKKHCIPEQDFKFIDHIDELQSSYTICREEYQANRKTQSKNKQYKNHLSSEKIERKQLQL